MPRNGHADPQESATVSPWLTPRAAWDCPTCTYINRPLALACEVCGSERSCSPSSAGSPGQPTPAAVSPTAADPRVAELRSLSGCSAEVAQQLLDDARGDLRAAMEAAVRGMLSQDDVRELTAEGVLRTAAPFDCPICMCPVAAREGIIIRSCGHEFCLDCVRHHMQSAQSGRVQCPHEGCQHMFEHREIRAVAGRDGFSVMDRRALEQGVTGDTAYHPCPTPDCTYIAYWTRQDGVPRLRCPLCKQTCCLRCQRRPYHNEQTCEEAARAEEEAKRAAPAATADSAAEQQTKQWLESNTRVCRRCKRTVVKSTGCDKMKCLCGYRFCFRCGIENAQCGCTPASHGFWDNKRNRGDFTKLRQKVSGT